MKRIVFICATLLLATASVLGYNRIAEKFLAYRTNAKVKALVRETEARIKVAPPAVAHTVFLKEVISSPTRAPVVSVERILAVREDGSTAEVRKNYSLNGVFLYSVRDVDRAGGIKASITDQIGSVVAMQLPNGDFLRAASGWDVRSKCSMQMNGTSVWTVESSAESVAGQEVTKLVQDGKTARITSWRAPALGCTELRRLAEFKGSDGKISSTSDLSAVTVTLGTPDPFLFSIPDSYGRLSVVENYKRLETFLGRTPSADIIQQIQPGEEAYQKFKYSGQ